MAKVVLYSDLNAIDPFNTPIVENVEAVYSFFHNLLNTSKKERPFRPYVGLNLDELLFDLSTDGVALQLYQMIIGAFETWLPIVTLDYGKTKVEPVYDDYRYIIEVAFYIKGWNEQLFIGGEVSK
jgi:phage baseplate assembly protein W